MRRIMATVILLLAWPAWADMYPDASNAKLPNALENFGHGVPLAAGITCTTVNGSAVVTGCNSTVGLGAGMAVVGPGIAAAAKIASGITATGFTMDANAGAGAGTGKIVVRFVPFWSDIDGGAPSIIRHPGRLMIGGAVGALSSRFGTYLTMCSSGADCANWVVRDSDLGVISQRGAIAVSGMSRTSDSTDVSSQPAAIGVSGFVINNDPARTGWALYADVQHEATANGRYSFGMEMALKNKGADYTSTAYASAPGVYGIRLSAGGDAAYGGSYVNPVNAGIELIPVTAGATFNKGIVFNSRSLTGSDGITGFGTAIEMAKGHVIKWKTPFDLNAFSIRSDVATSNTDTQIVANDNKITFVGPIAGGSGKIFEINHDGGTNVNYLQSFDAVAASAPGLRALGDDGGISIILEPKGAGALLIKSAAPAIAASGGTLPVQINLLKPSVFTVGTLPTCSGALSGVMASVTDATAPTYNGALTGGGGVRVPVFCNGAAWTSH